MNKYTASLRVRVYDIVLTSFPESDDDLGVLGGHDDVPRRAGQGAGGDWQVTLAFLENPFHQPPIADPFLDRAVGDRVPVYDDFTRIPYIRMMMKEVWRWRPPVALGHPHITSRDMQVGQYHLPKGSRLHINA